VIHENGDGTWYWVLIVQRYFEDFVVAAARLHEEVVGHRHPTVHRWAPNRLP
jgi:hypothetical protein